MKQPLSQFVTVLLLGTAIAAGLGGMCFLPAAAESSHTAGCHPARVPSNPHPADHPCCVSRHPSVLTTGIFSPRPTLQPQADAILREVASNGDAVPIVVAPYSGPPTLPILRI